MLLVRSFVVFATLLPVFPKPFRPRGNDTIAQNWNLTSISTSSTAAQTSETFATTSSKVPPYPIPGTGTGVITKDNGGRPKPTDQGSFTRPSPANNDTCGPCAVNIPKANVDWWYAATYQYPVATLTKVTGNITDGQEYLTRIPNTDTFDITSVLLSDIAYTDSLTFDSDWNVTWTYLDSYTVTPSAEITSVISRTAALPFPSGDIIPAIDIGLYNIPAYGLAAASFAVTGASGTVFVATSTTPVLYFSVYEVATAVPVTAEDGKISCSTTTETFSLPNPYAYSYDGKGIEELAVATGKVPEEFLQQVPQSSCSAGTYQATVTVLVVVDLTYVTFVGADPFLVHVESSALGFEPEPNVVAETKQPQPSQPVNPPPAVTQGNNNNPQSSLAKVHIESSVAPTQGNHDAGGNPGPGGPSAQEPTQVNVGTVGSETIKVGPSSVVVVGSQTLQPGGPAITVGGVPVSLVPSATAIVVGETTSALPQVLPPGAQTPAPPILTIGSSTFTANAATQFIVAPGQVLSPGGTATVAGTVVSLGPSASFLVIGGSTQILPIVAPAVTARPEIVVGANTFTANPGGSTFVVSGQTLVPGQAITVAGTTISLDPAATNVVVNGNTQPVLLVPVTAVPVLTFGNSQITANSWSTFVVNGQTLTPGGTITVDGTTIALGPSASFVVINGATSTLTNPAAQITPPPLTIGNSVFTALPGSGTTYIIGGQTLTPGGTITVAGSTISLAPGATALIINGQTTNLLPQTTITNPPLLTIGSHTYTALPGGGTTFVINGQTLTPGGVITVDGTTISLAPGATQLVYGSQGRSTTATLFPATTTRSQSITRTDQASAGATGVAGGATATKSKGVAYNVQPSGLESWILSLIVGFVGLVLG